MNPDSLCDLWSNYRATEIDRTIHPADDMFKKSVRGWTDYSDVVGFSATRVMLSVLGNVRAETIGSVLDFGCGHGRVARHLRAMLPEADLYFSDIDETGSKFCASQFQGEVVEAKEDFSELQLPTVDLIWVGSVFTHLDHARMIMLWDKLFASLNRGGALIATFRGRTMYGEMQKKADVASWTMLFDQYLSWGIGYQEYPHIPEWGLSLTTIAACTDLARRHPEAWLVGYTEAGWSNVHDVASWTKL